MKYIFKRALQARDLLEEIIKYFEGQDLMEGDRASPEESDVSDNIYPDFETDMEGNILQPEGVDPDFIIDMVEKKKKNTKPLEWPGAVSVKGGYKKGEDVAIPKLLEGSISKRKDGRWQGRYYDLGVRKYIYAHTKMEIVIALNNAILERNKRENDSIITKSISLNKWIQEFLTLYKSDLKEASKRDYETSLVRKTLDHPIGSKQVSKITPMDLDRFFMTIEAPNMRHRTFVLMKGCFTKLVQTKIIKENPFDFMDAIKKPRTKERDVPTAHELDDFFEYLKAADINLYYFAKFISVTGLRGGEALALEWKDINDSKIIINKSFDTTSGKISTPKSYASIRMIPLFPEAKVVIDKLNRTNQRVFSLISRWQSAKRISKLATEYGFKKFTLHTLRHYFATQCLNAGIAEKVTTAWLGHHDSKVAKDIYQHIKPDFESEQVDKLSKYRANKKKN